MHGEYKMPGGKLVVVDLDVCDGQLSGVQLSGDFFLEPDDALHTINAVLEGQSVHATEAMLTALLRDALSAKVMMYGISPEAVAVAVHRALHAGHSA